MLRGVFWHILRSMSRKTRAYGAWGVKNTGVLVGFGYFLTKSSSFIVICLSLFKNVTFYVLWVVMGVKIPGVFYTFERKRVKTRWFWGLLPQLLKKTSCLFASFGKKALKHMCFWRVFAIQKPCVFTVFSAVCQTVCFYGENVILGSFFVRNNVFYVCSEPSLSKSMCFTLVWRSGTSFWVSFCGMLSCFYAQKWRLKNRVFLRCFLHRRQRMCFYGENAIFSLQIESKPCILHGLRALICEKCLPFHYLWSPVWKKRSVFAWDIGYLLKSWVWLFRF